MKKIAQLSTVLRVGVVSCLSAPLLAYLLFQQGSLFKVEASQVQPDPHRLAQNRTSPPVPPLPEVLPEEMPPDEAGIVGLSPEPLEDIGIGHLRPKDLSFLAEPDWTNSPYLGANWLQLAAVPIYVEPEGAHWGWLVNGWLIPNGQEPIAIGRDATFLMLHTYHALFSFPVTEIREDGWFQLQYTPAGTAWAHIDHLNLGSTELTVERWEDRFLAKGWIEFRRHGLSQPLRPEPTDDEAILSLIGPDSFIEPIAFDGDWMQVRVTQPTNGCEFLPASRTQEGWMRWRGLESQSLIWYPPQGCE
ncbi:MAG: hypothetical protein F6J95_014570 [Leptolyngbya sp. SIO1E4]|nr:hypothetical protein [Leptolyngbya sp. SIO1E4]